MYLANLLLLRKSGKTTFGLAYKPGTPEYKRVITLASNINIAITATIMLASIVNLAYVVNKLTAPESKYPDSLVLFLAVLVVLMFIVMVPITRQQAKSMSDSSKDRRKHE